tara:strand:+ start:17 stop:1018 length:1002 start_codon:yes stop_codon:yes gene_type:complete
MPTYLSEDAVVYVGDCREQLKHLADNSVDSVVTDPPYELGFMGRSWDSTGVAYDVTVWAECLRVLKPGGHILAFGGSRTWHRLAVAVEDAGFEIRDSICWLYGQGFPKSLNVEKAMNKAGMDGSVAAGLGTALKPAHEPVVVGRKPFGKGVTVAENVLAWGVGGLNIDGSRIATDENLNGGAYAKSGIERDDGWGMQRAGAGDYEQPQGRWPANVILDEVTAGLLDEQSGENPSRFFYQAKASKLDRNEGLEDSNGHPTVKPTQLMRYLIKLVTPEGGTVLDPFTGSGSTGKAALLDGYKFVGVELTEDYLPIIEGRLRWALEQGKDVEGQLF